MLILLTRIMHWIPGLLIGLVLLWIFSWLYCKLFCQPSTEKRLKAKYDAEIEEIKSRLMFLQSKYDKLLKDKEAVDIDLQTCRDNSKQISAELELANQQNETRKNRILELEVFQAKYEDTNKKYHDTEAGLNALQLSFGQLENNHNGLRSDLADRDKEIAGYRSNITELSVYKDKYNSLLPRSEKMQAELDELRAALQAKESTIEEQKTSLFDLGKYKTEAIALGSALALANTAKDDQTAANADLQRAYDELLRTHNQLEADFAENKNHLLTAHTANNELELQLNNKNDEYNILMAQATQLQEDSAYYINRLDAGEKAYDELEGKLSAKSDEYNILMAQAHQLQEDCAYYMNRLDAGEEDYQELAEKLRDKNDEYDILMAQATQLQEDSAYYMNRLDAAENTYNQLNTQFVNQGLVYAALQSQFDDQASNYELLQGQFENQETNYNILMAQATQLQEDSAYYINRLDAAEIDYNELKEEKEDLQEDYSTLQAQANQLQEDSAYYMNRLDAAQKEYNELKEEKEDLQEDYSTLQAQANQLQEDSAYYMNRLDAAQKEYNELKEEKEDLQEDYSTLQAQANQLQEDSAFYLNRLDAAEEEFSELKAELNSQKAAYNTLQAQATQLQADCAECLDKLSDAEAAAANNVPQNAFGTGGMSEEDTLLMQISDKAADINFDRIGRADEADKDDLQRIKGIGPFIEKKLNALGIFTFNQIANFNNDDIEDVTKAIEFFPGRIERDKWVPQARGIVAELAKDASLAELSKQSRRIDFNRIGRASASEKDDLKRIKGIGPFIEKKLNALGIYTFRQISCFLKSDVDTVTDVIKFFPGRIERDNWVDQAAEFAKDSNA